MMNESQTFCYICVNEFLFELLSLSPALVDGNLNVLSKGSFTYNVISRGEGVFQILTVDEGGGGGWLFIT